jgi:hypothetical protein
MSRSFGVLDGRDVRGSLDAVVGLGEEEAGFARGFRDALGVGLVKVGEGVPG